MRDESWCSLAMVMDSFAFGKSTVYNLVSPVSHQCQWSVILTRSMQSKLSKSWTKSFPAPTIVRCVNGLSTVWEFARGFSSLLTQPYVSKCTSINRCSSLAVGIDKSGPSSMLRALLIELGWLPTQLSGRCISTITGCLRAPVSHRSEPLTWTMALANPTKVTSLGSTAWQLTSYMMDRVMSRTPGFSLALMIHQFAFGTWLRVRN